MLKAHAARDFNAVDADEHMIEELEKRISIDLDSNPCSVDCSSTKEFVAAATDRSFFSLLQATKSLANTMSIRFEYDGSDEWRVASPATLTDADNNLFKRYFSCKAVVDTAVETGALIMNEGCK